MSKVTFMPGGQSFDVAAGTTILVAAIQNGLQLRHDCSEAICGTDRVKILSGKEQLSEKNENEELTLEMMNGAPDDRLACVARKLSSVIVETPGQVPQVKIVEAPIERLVKQDRSPSILT